MHDADNEDSLGGYVDCVQHHEWRRGNRQFAEPVRRVPHGLAAIVRICGQAIGGRLDSLGDSGRSGGLGSSDVDLLGPQIAHSA